MTRTGGPARRGGHARARRLVLLLAALAACARTPGRGADASSCPPVSSGPTAVAGLCETVHACARPPGGRFDRIGVRRLARCDGTTGPVVLHLPGGHMNGALPEAVPDADLRVQLARDGVVVWSLDYRTHAVPPDAASDALAALAGWTAEGFADDAATALATVRAAERTTPWLSGFSYGAGLAYRLAARGEPIAGLIVLDGAPPGGRPAPSGDSPAIDLAGGRLGWPDRERLLDAAMRDPGAASPLAGFATAGDALAAVVHGARAFGGAGGLSAVRDGATDVRALAVLLATYDRWWPRATLAGEAVAPRRPLPVLAFAAERMGPAWVERVRDGAIAFGGPAAVVHELRGFGHVDVLVGKDVPVRVAPAVRAFVGVSRRARASTGRASRTPCAPDTPRTAEHAPCTGSRRGP